MMKGVEEDLLQERQREVAKNRKKAAEEQWRKQEAGKLKCEQEEKRQEKQEEIDKQNMEGEGNLGQQIKAEVEKHKQEDEKRAKQRPDNAWKDICNALLEQPGGIIEFPRLPCEACICKLSACCYRKIEKRLSLVVTTSKAF
jgi:hypothetical protein